MVDFEECNHKWEKTCDDTPSKNTRIICHRCKNCGVVRSRVYEEGNIKKAIYW